jgi:hypothetical protein
MNTSSESGRKNIESGRADRWDELHNLVDGCSQVSHMRNAYFTSLITFGKEFELCGRDAAANMMFHKIEKELKNENIQDTGKGRGNRNRFERVSVHLVQRQYEEVMSFFEMHKALFPSSEAQHYREELNRVKAKLYPEEEQEAGHGKRKEGAMPRDSLPDSLRQIRDSLYDRVARYKGTAARLKLSESGDDTGSPDGTGFYNNRYNLHFMLGLIHENDPFWVEDLLAHYRKLQRLSALFS